MKSIENVENKKFVYDMRVVSPLKNMKTLSG